MKTPKLFLVTQLIIFLTISYSGFGQETVTLNNGTRILVYPNKTWDYERIDETEKIINSTILVNINDGYGNEIRKYQGGRGPIVNFTSKEGVELISHSYGHFKVKSSSGQIGYVYGYHSIDNYEDYEVLLENRAIEMAKAEGKKLLINGVGITTINSSGGVELYIDWGYFDQSQNIKYISFTVVPYNSVGDIQTCEITGRSSFTGQITGPISASDKLNLSRWESAWYNNTITCIRLTKVVVNYLNGTSYTYVKELPRLLPKDYINVCK